MATLPGDPREDLNITLGCDDVCHLEENEMLHISYWVLFCILVVCIILMQMRLTIALVEL